MIFNSNLESRKGYLHRQWFQSQISNLNRQFLQTSHFGLDNYFNTTVCKRPPFALFYLYKQICLYQSRVNSFIPSLRSVFWSNFGTFLVQFQLGYHRGFSFAFAFQYQYFLFIIYIYIFIYVYNQKILVLKGEGEGKSSV